MTVVRASACSPSMDDVKPARFTLSFAFCKPFRQAQATQQRKNGAQPTLHCSNDSDKEGRYPGKNDQKKRGPDPAIIRTNYLRKSTKNRSKIHERPSQIDEKSTKNRSWTVLGVKSRFGDVSGRVRDAPGTCQSRPRSDLEDVPRRPKRDKTRPKSVPRESK